MRQKKNPNQEKNYSHVDNKPVERKTVNNGDYQAEILNFTKGTNISKPNRTNDLPYGYAADQTKNSMIKKDPPVILIFFQYLTTLRIM